MSGGLFLLEGQSPAYKTQSMCGGLSSLEGQTTAYGTHSMRGDCLRDWKAPPLIENILCPTTALILFNFEIPEMFVSASNPLHFTHLLF